ncbi:transcription factor [Pseudozyma hubeiensis SY62]|uniref:Pre-mRNA-splicing factor PRP46 n=1 Tax=Pseudozyma hubeiensis (strain SY62) TaxID=1305764 RepID=R9PC19_PSEHS|nr:transcription factor [Pseudozyma hubeiensis SY62]GAC98879.1 transcription factor [Pseudozyma hubeiensis SY62]
MAQHARDVGSHPDEPPAKRRTLQIKLGRPRPSSSDLQQPEQQSPSLNRNRQGNPLGIRISLKRKPSIAESQATPPRFAPHFAEDQEDEEQNEDDEDDDHQIGTVDASEQEDNDDDGDDDDDGEGEDDEEDDEQHENGGDDHDGEEMEEDEEDVGEMQSGDHGGGSSSAANGDAALNPRSRGSNGAFKTTSSGNGQISRRPIKRLRSKGLYEALPKLIENLQRRDSYKFFCEPVNPDEVPGYADVIKTPMDFGTMQSKVDQRLYSHIDQVKADFQLVISNAMTFNPEGTLYYNEAKRIGAWGNRAIEREGMAVNDNGRAGVKGDELRRQKRLAREAAATTSAGVLDGPSSTSDGPGRRQLRASTAFQQQSVDDANMQQLTNQEDAEDMTTRSAARGSRFAFSAGIEAIMEAARSTSQARQRAAIALGLTGGTLTREDSVQPGAGVKVEGDMDLDDDDDDDASDEDGGMRAGMNRERSVTVDGVAGISGRRFGSSQPGGTPSTPMGQRQASPSALRRRLAAVTGTPLQALASPMGATVTATGGTSRASKHVKHKQRLGALGTPKRLLARTGLAGSATPLAGTQSAGISTDAIGAPLDPAGSAAAAAQLIAELSQTQLQPANAHYSFDDDGSINPDDIDDLQAFLTLHRSGRNVLMPIIESLHPIPFVPGDYVTSSSADDQSKDQDREQERSKEKEKAKDKAAADDGEDDDEDGKGDTREKGDKDPLSTLPPARPGAPDPLYTAIAPEAEPQRSNFSHDVEALPPHFRNLPFYAPSLPSKSLQDRDAYSLLHSWDNPAYTEALKNDKRPKKQKDKEREKERETLEDWSYFRPTLTRLLDITDLGPLGALVPRVEGGGSSAPAKTMAKGKAANDDSKRQAAIPSSDAFSTALLGEQGIEAIKAELRQEQHGQTHAREILRRSVALAKAGNGEISLAERQAASQSLSDVVYAGVAGNAYIRSVGEFVGGAIHHAMLLDEVDDEQDQQIAEAEKSLRLAAALRKAKETEATPEPTAASRRGPFMWRDTTEEAAGTATPSGAAEHDIASGAHTIANATPAPEAEDGAVDPAISELLQELEKVEAPLAPLSKPLAQVVEEEIVLPITGHTLDILHLVAVQIKALGYEGLDIEEIEARLLKDRIWPQAPEAHGADMHAARPAKASVASATSNAPAGATALPPVPFAAELAWLKDQPELSGLLDEARMDVNSLGSIVNYVIQSA